MPKPSPNLTAFKQELQALYEKALELKKNGRVHESEALELQAAGILRQLKERAEQNPQDPLTADILVYLAEREWAILGDHAAVLSKLQQALALLEKHHGPDHSLTAEAAAKLAEVHFLAGRLELAERLFRQAVTAYEKREHAQDPMYAKSLEGLARTLSSLGRRAEADPYFAQAIERARDDEEGKRPLYFLLIHRAEGLETLHRPQEAAQLRQRANALLPKTNPGELGFQV